MRNKKWQIILLVVILLAGLAMRLLIAPNKGFSDDIMLFQFWSYSTVKNGIGHVYNTAIGQWPNGQDIPLPNYLPLYIYFLKFSGSIYQSYFSPDFKIGIHTPLTFILKLNGIIFDLLTAVAIFWLLKKIAGYKTAIITTAVYYFNPGIIYNSSYWGQVDSIQSFFIIFSLYFLAKRKLLGSWILITLAMLMKLQSFIILPLVILVTIKEKGWKNLARYMLLALGIFVIIIIPFIASGNFLEVIKVIFTSVGYSPYISMNAFNIWWPFTGGDLLAVNDKGTLLHIPYFMIGMTLFICIYFDIMIFLKKINDYKGVFFAASFASFAFFMLPTEMHERYMFPVLPILAMVLFLDKRFRFIYLILSVTFFINLMAVFPFDSSDLLFGLSLNKSLWVAIVNILVFIYFFYLAIDMLRKKNKSISQPMVLVKEQKR